MAMAASPKLTAAAMFFLITLITMPDVDGDTATATAETSINITEILSEFPEFATFSKLLSQMNLTGEINRRQATTVFVSDNSAAAAIAALPAETQRKVLAVQVILDYYDPVKLDAVTNNTAQLTTLFQASGAATDRMGFVTFTQGGDDQFSFSSAEPGAATATKSELVKVVACRPYNISVMQLSAPIIPPGIGSPAGNRDGAPAAFDPPLPKASSVSTMDVEEPEFSDDDSSDPDVEQPAPAAADAPSSLIPITRIVGIMGSVMFII